jgi:predicted AlkP superfamily phosphohydrolase/phosphomutase
LREHGYCVYVENTPAQQASAFNWILKQWTQEQLGLSGRSEKLFRRIVQTVVPRLPRAGQERFWARIDQVIPFAHSHVLLSTRPDFARTRVFPGSLYSGLLYFNVYNREPNGVIPAGERSELVARLKEELAEIRDPDSGERLFANIFSSEELYHGAVAEHAPDLIVDAYQSHWNIRTRQPAPHRGQRHGHYFVTFDHSRDYGWHSPDGVFVFAGPAFQSGQAAHACSLLDIPATLLHVYDVPLPQDWDGRVALELLAFELSQQPIRTQPGDAELTFPSSIDENVFTEEEADSMISHLRALGYLD